MPNPTIQEVAPQTIVKEAIPPIPSAGSSAEMAKKIREDLEQGNWRQAMEFIRRPAVKEGEMKEKIEQIGVERDAATGKKARGPEEEARYNRAKKGEEQAKKLLEVGYDKLTSTEKKAFRDKILAQAMRDTGLKAQLDTLTTDADKNAFAERYLRDPKYLGEVQRLLGEAAEVEIGISSESIEEAKQKAEEKQLEKTDKQADIDDVNRRLTQVDAQLNDFERPAPGAAGTLGAKAAEIDRIKNNLTTIQTELATYKKQAESAQLKINLLMQERQASLRPGWAGRPMGDIDIELVAETGNRDTAQTEANKREGDLQDLPRLELEQQQLETRRQDLVKEQREKALGMGKIDLDLNRRKAELEDLKTLRASQEEDLASSFENVTKNSIANMLEQQYKDITYEFGKEIEKRKTEATSSDEKAMWGALKDRWLGAERRRRFLGLGEGTPYRPIDKQKVNGDFSTLLDKGPEEIFKKMLDGRTNPTTSALYTLAEIDTLIQNRDFVDKMQPEMIKQLIGRKILTGGISREDIHIITNVQWGKDMIAGAMERNEEFKKNVEAVIGAGAISRAGFFERFAQEARKNPWWLLLLIFGVGALGLKAAQMTTGQEGIATT